MRVQMSDNLPVQKQTTDITTTEMAKVTEFIEKGLPGIAEVPDHKLHRMLDLYLSGSTYTQIANILELKKVVVLYFAYKSNWFELKQEFLLEIEEKIKNRVIDAKLKNKEFMLLLVQAWQKKVSKTLHRYLSTNVDTHMEELNLKEIAQLMKAIEIVNDMDNAGKTSDGKQPAIGLNLGDGVVVERTGENQVSITPKSSTIGSKLQQLADERRALESVKHDIIDTKGEQDENQ